MVLMIPVAWWGLVSLRRVHQVRILSLIIGTRPLVTVVPDGTTRTGSWRRSVQMNQPFADEVSQGVSSATEVDFVVTDLGAVRHIRSNETGGNERRYVVLELGSVTAMAKIKRICLSACEQRAN